MGNLRQDADAVSCLPFCILASPVLQIFYNMKRVFYCFMGFLSFDIDTRTNTAVVVFKFLSVKHRLGKFIFYVKHEGAPFFLSNSDNGILASNSSIVLHKKVAKEPLGYAPLRLEHYYTPYEAGCKDFFYFKLSDNLLT